MRRGPHNCEITRRRHVFAQDTSGPGEFLRPGFASIAKSRKDHVTAARETKPAVSAREGCIGAAIRSREWSSRSCRPYGPPMYQHMHQRMYQNACRRMVGTYWGQGPPFLICQVRIAEARRHASPAIALPPVGRACRRPRARCIAGPTAEAVAARGLVCAGVGTGRGMKLIRQPTRSCRPCNPS